MTGASRIPCLPRRVAFWAVVIVATTVLTAGSAQAQTLPAADLTVTYVNDGWENLAGGLRRGGARVGKLQLDLAIDAQRAVGWTGATFGLSVFHVGGDGISSQLVGDLQGIDGNEAQRSTRLHEAWVEQRLGALAVKAGLIDLNGEFDVRSASALFINGAYGLGPEVGQIGENGPSTFPLTGLGARGAVNLGDHWQVKAGVFDGDPGGGAFSFHRRQGALLIAEVARDIKNGTKVSLGWWRHTAAPSAVIPAGIPVDLRVLKPASGAYAFAEAPVARVGGRRIDLFMRLGLADSAVFQITRYLGAGAVLTGPLLFGDDERLGLAVSVADVGGPFRRAQEMRGQFVDKREIDVELTYRSRPLSWLAIQPDIQFIRNPGANPAVRDAWVAGVRLELSWKPQG